MGCDIHLYTEAKRTIDNNLQWVNVDNWKINHYFKKGNADGEKEYEISHMYRNRNYSLFAILAGVRDYSEKTKSVSEPKGLPADISFHTKEEADKWDGDGHTHSWLTLGELKRFQGSQPTVVHSGLITEMEAKELDEKGIFPNSWCQGTNLPNYVHREWTMPDNSLNKIIAPLQEKLKDEFWISDINDVSKDEDIRIVFWFDN